MTKRFGAVTATRDVTLKFRRDTFMGLLGCNRAGKTALMSLITGQETPTAGSARVLGQDPRENSTVSATFLITPRVSIRGC